MSCPGTTLHTHWRVVGGLSVGASAIAVAYLSTRLPLTPTLLAATAVVITLAFRLRTLELVVVLAPFMFYVAIPTAVNLSAATFLVPLAATYALTSKRTDKIPTNGPLSWLVATFACLLVSFALGLFLDAGFNATAGVVAVLKIAVGCAVFLLVPTTMTTPSRIARIWVLTSVVIALLALLSALGIVEVVRTDGVRTSGTFEDPNLFGAYLVLSMALAASPRVTESFILRCGFALVLGGAILTTGSRGSLAAALALVVAFFILSPTVGARAKMLATLAFPVLLVIQTGIVNLGAVPGTERLVNSGRVAGEDVRLEIWASAVQAWLQNPALGIGPGQFDGEATHVVHNTFINVLVSSGAIGLIAFVAFLLRLAAPLWALRKDPHARVLLVGGVGIVVEMMTLNLENILFVWLYLGIMWSHARESSRPAAAASNLKDRARKRVDDYRG
jgi:O-antigen ligase